LLPQLVPTRCGPPYCTMVRPHDGKPVCHHPENGRAGP
jgi:hypothetical protein